MKFNLLIATLVALMALSFAAAGTLRYNKANAATDLQLIFIEYMPDYYGFNLIQSYIPGVDLTNCDFSAFADIKLKKAGTDIEYKLGDLQNNPSFPNCIQNAYIESNNNHGINFLIPITETIPSLSGYSLVSSEEIELSTEYTLLPFQFDIGIVEVTNVFCWGGTQSSIAIDVDMKKGNWDTWELSSHGGYAEALHPFLTLNGIRYNPAGTYFTFEEYPGVNLYLESQFLGGPSFGYAMNHTIALFFLYGTNSEGAHNVPDDTVLTVDGPICCWLGETGIAEVVTYQKVSGDWHKVSGITFTAPTKTVYAPNEAIDTTGAKINVTYADGTPARAIDYADALTNTGIEGFDTSKPGDYTAYVNYHGVQIPFSYTVEAPMGDVFANTFAYAGTETAHTVSIAFTAEITAEQASALAAEITVTGDGRTVSAIEGATVTATGATFTVSIPTTEITDFYGKGIKLAADCEVDTGITVKAFEQTFGGTTISLPIAVFFNDFVIEGTAYQLILAAVTADPLKGSYADLTALTGAIKIIGGDQPIALSAVNGAFITYPGDGYFWIHIPSTEYPSFAGYGLQLTESVTLPSLDKMEPFKYVCDGTSLYKETYVLGAWAHGAAGLRFNIRIPGGGTTADVADFGTDGSSLHANLTINGQQNRFTFTEYPGMTIWMSGQGLGAAAWGLGDADTYSVIIFSYEERVYGETGVRNFVEGTLVTLGRNFTLNGCILDRDYTYQLVSDGGSLVWKEVASVSVSAPTKTNYFVSEAFDTTGIAITVRYTDGTSAVYGYGAYCSIEGFDNINAGENKTAYVNYRGVKVPFNYTIERVAGEINVVSVNYSADANNHYVTIGLNDVLPDIDYSALASSVTIGGTAVSAIDGATLSYEGGAFVITIPKTAYSFTGSFTTALADGYQIMEGSTLKAFEFTYATSVLTTYQGGFFPNFQDGGYHIALFGITGDPVKSGYADFAALANAVKIVHGNESVAVSATNGGYITYNFDPSAGYYLWIYIPAAAYPSFDGYSIVLEEAVTAPSLDNIAPFSFVIYGSSTLIETHIVDAVFHGSAGIRFNIYMPGHDSDDIQEIFVSDEQHSFRQNLTVNGQNNRYTFVEYPDVPQFYGAIQTLGALPHGGNANTLWIIVFLYGANGEGPRDYTEGTIVKIGQFNIYGYILDREYTYQAVRVGGELVWKEIVSVTVSEPSVPFYAVGETFDGNAYEVTVTYADGTAKTYALASDASATVTGFSTGTVGEGTATIGYHGYEFAYEYSVKEITGFTVTEQPGKTTYKVGEVMNLNGLSIDVEFGEGFTRTVEFGSAIPAGFTVTGFDSSEPNENLAVTIYHGDLVAATVYLTIQPPIVESITVTAPTKRNYYVGDTLALDGGYLVPYFDTGIYGDSIALDAEGVTVTGFDSSSSGVVTVTVTYEGTTDTFEVTIADVVITYVEGTAPTVAVYEKGAELTVEGGYFTVYYNNGSSIEIDFTDEQVTFVFDKDIESEIVEVTVFYGSYSYTFTATVEKTVNKQDIVGCFAGVAGTMPVFLFVLAAAVFGVRRKSENQ